MLDINEAQQLILQHVHPLERELVSPAEARGRVLYSDIRAVADIPGAPLSAMDGYCYSSAGIRDGFARVVDFIPAGELRTVSVKSGEAVRIMTGAPLPAGCDTVVPFEEVESRGDGILLKRDLLPGANVRGRGDDVKAGELLLSAGTLLSPQAIGLVISIGLTGIPVFRRPRVAIIATGDEVVPIGGDAVRGQVFNSNSYTIAAQIEEAGGIPAVLGIAPDSMEAICDLLRSALDADLVITTGGASVGDRDFVKDAIVSLGGEIIFWKVRMKPGKPVALGMIGNKPIFVLPGNPVSAMVGTEMFVRPALMKTGGRREFLRNEISAVTTDEMSNPNDRSLIMFVAAAAAAEVVTASRPGGQSSTAYMAMTRSNGYICIPPGEVIGSGSRVRVRLFAELF